MQGVVALSRWGGCLRPVVRRWVAVGCPGPCPGRFGGFVLKAPGRSRPVSRCRRPGAVRRVAWQHPVAAVVAAGVSPNPCHQPV